MEARWLPPVKAQQKKLGSETSGPRSAVSSQPTDTMAAPIYHAMQASSLGNQGPVPQLYDTSCEAFRERFRQFQYREAAGPQEAFCKLWELCCQWLKPQTRSVEQILAMLVLEQFIRILPADTETTMGSFGPENRQRLFSMIENLQRDHGKPEYQIHIREMLLKELMLLCTFHTPSDMHLRPHAVQAMEPVQGPLLIPPAKELSRSGGQCQIFLDTGLSLLKEYEQLEPPGEEPPEELLADGIELLESQRPCPEEMLGSSNEVRPLSLGAHMQKSPTEKPLCCAQLGICVVHKQECDTHLNIHTGEVAHEGPGGETASFHESDNPENQSIYQEKGLYGYPLWNKPLTQVTPVNERQRNTSARGAYHCLGCKRKFVYKSSLDEHMKSHTSPKSYVCSSCGKSFRGRSQLIAHQATHTEERPFTCEYCKQNYKYRSCLLRHLRVHTGERTPPRSPSSQTVPGSQSSMSNAGLIAPQPAHLTAELPNSVLRDRDPAERGITS